MEKIQIPLRGIQTRHNPHDIETALAWNAIKKTLETAGREDLFGYIQSVKVTEKYITIKTGKPLIIAELKTIFSLGKPFQKELKIL